MSNTAVLLLSKKKVIIINTIDASSSDGNLKKWIVQIEGKKGLFYLKSSSGKNKFECEAEVVASKLGEKLGLPMTKYYMDVLKTGSEEFKVCVSQDFTGSLCYTPLANICVDVSRYRGKEKYDYVLKCLENVNIKNAKLYLDNLLIFDSIINNHDRHLNNIGLLSSKSELKFAPVFDCGDSLFSTLKNSDLNKVLKMRLTYTKCKPFNSIHSAQRKMLGSGTLKSITKADIYNSLKDLFDANRTIFLSNWLELRLSEEGLLK